MNTPEGILIEDGELTIHVRKASKVRSIKLKLSHNEVFFLQKSKRKGDLMRPSQISQMFSDNKFDSIQDDLLKIELQKKFGGK